MAQTLNSKTLPPAWLLVLCCALGPLAMTVAVPANTEIMRDFETEYGVAQSMLSIYLLSMGVAQLFLGFLSDKFGRRPVMIVGLSIFALGCIVCAIAPTLELLLVSRAIQGIGSSVGVSLSRAIVRDVYSREKSASVIAYLSMAMVIAPMIGPGFGGALTEYASWRYIFVILSVIVFLTLLMVLRYLNETGIHYTDLASRPKFIPSSSALLSQPAFVGYAIGLAFAAGMFFAFQAAAPFLVMETMGRSATEYGVYFAITAMGYFTGNLISARLSQRFGPDKMIQFAIIPAAIGLIAIWSLRDVSHPLALFAPMSLLTLSNGLTIPNATAAALSVKPHLAGTAAGLAGFFQIGLGALLSFGVGFVQTGAAWPLLLTLTLCGVVTAFGAWLGHRYRLASINPEP